MDDRKRENKKKKSNHNILFVEKVSLFFVIQIDIDGNYYRAFNTKRKSQGKYSSRDILANFHEAYDLIHPHIYIY